jgi:hypothetical protein
VSDDDKSDILAALASPKGQEAIRRGVLEALAHFSRDTMSMLQLLSTLKSADFLIRNVPLHLGQPHGELRRKAVQRAPNDGLFLEFGVYTGNWINALARYREVTFYGFDSFEGLPDPWSLVGSGHFALGGQLPKVEPNVVLIKGWFHESLPPFLAEHPEPVSFIHMDCDLYSSTTTVLNLLKPRIHPGTEIVLDDYMLEPGWERQEHKAFHDFAFGNGIGFEYTGYSNEFPACSASVVITRT